MGANRIIGVVGLGYVGLPVTVEFAQKFRTIGFDVNQTRVGDLKKGIDKNGEIPSSMLEQPNLTLTSEIEQLKEANFYIIAVPTPIDEAKRPDLLPVLAASKTVGKVLKRDDIVVYESTVYPGATEEDCIPVLEATSGLKAGVDFKVGYSPERINPGDQEHQFKNILKIVSGQDSHALNTIAEVYGEVVKAGVYRAESIRVAEASKVIENTQRDLNIALMNELAIIFDLMKLNTSQVIRAASTKWNFLKFHPGLVGGHCIGVDPYYLTHKAEMYDYHPQVILAGRRINDGMGKFIAQKTIKEMIRAGITISNSTVTILGLTFKEDCRDIRNTRVIDIISELKEYGVTVTVCDPMAHPEEAEKEYGISLVPFEALRPADALVVAVNHQTFKEMSFSKIRSWLKNTAVITDVKGTLGDSYKQDPNLRYWQL